jgi:hypothetical protein
MITLNSDNLSYASYLCTFIWFVLIIIWLATPTISISKYKIQNIDIQKENTYDFELIKPDDSDDKKPLSKQTFTRKLKKDDEVYINIESFSASHAASHAAISSSNSSNSGDSRNKPNNYKVTQVYTDDKPTGYFNYTALNDDNDKLYFTTKEYTLKIGDIVYGDNGYRRYDITSNEMMNTANNNSSKTGLLVSWIVFLVLSIGFKLGAYFLSRK